MSCRNKCIICFDDKSELNCHQCSAKFHIDCIQTNFAIDNHGNDKCPQCDIRLKPFYFSMRDDDLIEETFDRLRYDQLGERASFIECYNTLYQEYEYEYSSRMRLIILFIIIIILFIIIIFTQSFS